MKKIFLMISVLMTSLLSNAQDIFISKGKIEYERKVNIHKEIEAFADEDNGWIQNLKKSLPQYDIGYFDLYFDDNKTLYKPGRDVIATQKIPDWFQGPAKDNVISNDLNSAQMIGLKNVYETSFLVQDSLRKIDWRITPDTRTIAGFECRKAVGRIMDSVYVIAFYTDQIMVSGGPESFTGLPGMILGVAIPRINTTWFATKLQLIEIKPEDLLAPKKGKKVTSRQLLDQLKTSTKDWGKYGQRNIWHVMI